MGIGKRIKEARINKNLTQEELAKILGVTKGAVANYETEVSHPKESVMYALIEALGVDANFLFQDCVKTKKSPPELSNEALSVAKDYDSLDSRGKSTIKAALSHEKSFISAQSSTKSTHQEDEGGKVVALPTSKRNGHGFIEIKVYNQPAAAGLGNYLDEPDYRVEQYPPKVIPSKTDFGVIISGDSMEPKIHDGGTVFVQSAPSIEPGNIGIFVLNSRAYCKKLVVDQDNRQILLVSLNPQYEDIIVNEDSDTFRTLGRVLGQWTPGYKQDLLGW